MRTVTLRVLAIIVVISVALATVGGTTATWSDTETAEGNVVETGSLDLLVAKCAEGWASCGEFSEDQPWCSGLQPCFDIPEAELCMTYACYLLLWNAGCVDGVAYLHVKNVNVSNGQLDSSTNMKIWYDDDGLPETTLMLVGGGTIGGLACHEIELGLLPAEATRQLKLQIIPYEGSGGDSVTFNIVFELIQHELPGRRYAWADTEQNLNCLTLKVDIGGTPGFWNGPGALELHGKPQIAAWFKEIVGVSAWFSDVTVSVDSGIDYEIMRYILGNVGGGGYEGKVNQFRAQYLATRLNAISGQLSLRGWHDISAIGGLGGYPSPLWLADIISLIESQAEGDVFTPGPPGDQIETMKDLCEALNELRI